MLYFLLAVLFTVALYLIMRSFPKWKVDVFHAVVFNYYACVITGLILTPGVNEKLGNIDWSSPGTICTLALGALFISVFLLIGQATIKAGVTAASLASNLSLVIPVIFGLFVFHNAHKEFTVLNYLGLVLTIPALAMGSWSGNSGKVSKSILIWPALCFLVSGSSNTLINYLTSTFYEPGSNTIFMIIACSGAVLLGTGLLIAQAVRSGTWPALRSVGAGFLLGVPNFLSLYFLLKALSDFGNSAAFVFPVYNILTMLASAMMAFLFFKEKHSGINRAGLLIAVISILLISYQELGIPL